MIAGCSGSIQQSNPTSSTFLQLLKLQPDSALSTARTGQAYILMNDFAKIRDVYGISLPTTSDEQDLDNYLLAMLNADHSLGTLGPDNLQYAYGSGFRPTYMEKESIRAVNVGYGPTNVDASIESSTGIGLIGNFNPQATQTAFKEQTGWPQWAKDGYTTENYQNITINSWGDVDPNTLHLLDTLGPPDTDELGRACPLAVTPTNVFYSSSTANIKSMIDTSLGKSTSMANDPKYASVAKGLTELGAYSAIIANTTTSEPDFAPKNPLTDTGTQLQPYLTFGSGEGKDNEGIYLAVVLVYGDNKAAANNAGILQTRIDQESFTDGTNTTPWKQIITDSKISVEGNMILAKVYDNQPSFLSDPEALAFGLPLLADQ
jgi:hypothetical protein